MVMLLTTLIIAIIVVIIWCLLLSITENEALSHTFGVLGLIAAIVIGIMTECNALTTTETYQISNTNYTPGYAGRDYNKEGSSQYYVYTSNDDGVTYVLHRYDYADTTEYVDSTLESPYCIVNSKTYRFIIGYTEFLSIDLYIPYDYITESEG